jgi:hypothetical protein
MFATRMRSVLRSRRTWLLGLAGVTVLWCLGCTYGGYAVAQNDTYGAYVETQGNMDDVQYLASYGVWEDVSPWGMVWRPSVVARWAPFSNGHWVWSNYGWAWVSYEPFGWLVFHYGYWNYEPSLGWYWIPGHKWSPARVEWECFGGYTAWAPLPPPGVYWPDPWGPYPVDVWVVVNNRHFEDEDIGRQRALRPEFAEHARSVVPVRHAPNVHDVELALGRAVPMVKVEKREMNIRPRFTAPQPRYAYPKNTRLHSITLPPEEKRKVDENRPRVEREVLTPSKKQSAPAPREQQKGKTDTGGKKKHG